MGLSVAHKNLEAAMDAIENEESNLSFEERFDNLMQAGIAFAWFLSRKAQVTGKKTTKEDEARQEVMMRQLHKVDRIFTIAKKHKRIANAPNFNFDRQLAQQIKAMNSSIGEIVSRLPDNKKEKEN